MTSVSDFIPTFAAANAKPDLVEKVKKGYAMGDKTYKVHLDGVNLMRVPRTNRHARVSSTGAMMAIAWRCA
jgi:hypothetical protein